MKLLIPERPSVTVTGWANAQLAWPMRPSCAEELRTTSLYAESGRCEASRQVGPCPEVKVRSDQ